MSVVAVSLLGRFGNTLFQYAYAKAYALKHGAEFQCDPGWIGYRIFQLEDPPISREDLPRQTELTVNDGEVDICFRTYAQHQKAAIYTQQQIWDWFKFRPEILDRTIWYPTPFVAAHYRADDFLDLGYPVCSKQSFINAAKKANLCVTPYFVSEEKPHTDPEFDSWAPFLPDFMILTQAPILFRANSSFSWWAAAIGKHDAVYSPRIDGLEGGKIHDVEFVIGNHPRLSDHDFVTDIHLPT